MGLSANLNRKLCAPKGSSHVGNRTRLLCGNRTHVAIMGGLLQPEDSVTPKAAFFNRCITANSDATRDHSPQEKHGRSNYFRTVEALGVEPRSLGLEVPDATVATSKLALLPRIELGYRAGFEPASPRFLPRCINQLSYRRSIVPCGSLVRNTATLDFRPCTAIVRQK